MRSSLHRLSEYSLAVVLPEGQIYFIRTQWEVVIGHLEKSKLVAVLVGPLTPTFVLIYSGVT